MPVSLKVLISVFLFWLLFFLPLLYIHVHPAEASQAAIFEFEEPLGPVPRPLTTQELIVKYAEIYHVDSDVLLKVANCEGSTQFKPDGSVVRGIVNHKDVGLFQINEDYHLGTSKKMGLDIYTTEGNIEYASWLYQREGVGPWLASQSCWSNK